MDRVLHELRVHQAELEAQNEELRRTQLQLEQARERYFDLYELAPVGYVTVSQDGLIQEVNRTFADLLKQPREKLLRRPLSRFVVPEDAEVYQRHRRELVNTGMRQVCELRMSTQGGEPCWVRLEETLAHEDCGLRAGRVVVSDISQRKRAEEAIRSSEVRHRVLFEKSRDALMTLAPPDFRFTSGNSRTLALFGVRDEAHFLSHRISDFSPPRQPDGTRSYEGAMDMIRSAMREGAHHCEWVFKRLSGEEFPASVISTRVEIDKLPLLLVTVRDETETKKLQAMLSQQDRLASMGLLAASVAHEVNNPLASILYNVETMVEDLPKVAAAAERCLQTLGAVQRERAPLTDLGDGMEALSPAFMSDLADRAKDAHAGAQRITTITKAIGTFARVDTTERRRVDLNYAIKCAMTLARNDIKFRAKLVVDFGQVPRVWASEGKVSQVFLNLLLNAAHAIGEGDSEHNEIRIRTWSEGESVFAEVVDTGGGIAKENLDRIFEPFFTTKPVGVGSGLGLAICRSIIDDFGGNIRAESESGAGARFVVRLPARRGTSDPPRPISGSSSPAPAIDRKRILVVDDEQVVRSILARVLDREHDLVLASSGEAAIAILENDARFDVVLCDLMMPGITGMDLREWLEAHRPPLASRVVFITGGAFTAKASQYVERAGTVWLEKPFDPRQLKQVILDVIEAHAKPRKE